MSALRASSSWLSGRLRLQRARPPLVWTAALLYLCGALRCLLVVAAPLSSSEPVTLAGAIGIAAALIAGALWWWGDRLPILAFQAMVALTVVMASLLVALSHSPGGAILTAFAYPWLAVYSANFFKPRAVIATVALIGVSFGAALIAGGHHRVVVSWVMVMGTVATLAWILQHLNQALRRQADTDHLTGLLNRSGFLAAARRERASADRSGEPLTVVVLDLDRFKQVNDRLGHAAGDRLLEQLGAAWKARLRGQDIIARHGGDEFVLLLPSTGEQAATDALRRLRVPDVAVRWSAGISEWRPGEDIDECLARADRDLYASKDALHELVQADAILANVR